MNNIDIGKIEKLTTEFIKERDWEQFHSIKNLVMALSVETSELVELFQWLKEEETNDIKNNPKLKQRAEEEIADIFIYLLRIAINSGIDIEKAALLKIKKNAQKYPVEKSKGNSLKYKDFS